MTFLPLGLEGLRALDFLEFVVGVACGFHPRGQEEAAFLGFGVVGEDAVALLGEAFLAFGEQVAVVADFAFAVGKESTVLFALVAPAHILAAVERSEAAARDHDVELAVVHVATDVGCHHDEGLAGERLVVGLGLVLALAGEGEGEALAALASVSSRDSREGVGDLVARDDRNLACAGGTLAAAADTAATAADGVLALGVAGLGRVAAGILVPAAARHAAVPVTGCPALLAALACTFVLGCLGVALSAAALGTGLNLLAAGRLCAGTGLCAARGLGAGAGLRAAGRLGAGTACRSGPAHIRAILAFRVVIALQFAFLVVGVLFVLGALEVFVRADALARGGVEALVFGAALFGRGGLRLFLLLAGAGGFRLLDRAGGLRLFRVGGRRRRRGDRGFRTGNYRVLASLVGVLTALIRVLSLVGILALVGVLALVRVNGVGIVKDVAAHIGNCTVGSDKCLFRSDSCKGRKVNSRGNRCAFGIDDSSRRNIEVSDGGAGSVCDDEPGFCRGNDIRHVALENPASGGDNSELSSSLRGGVSNVVVGAVPGDHQGAGKQQCLKKWKFHHNLMFFFAQISRP